MPEDDNAPLRIETLVVPPERVVATEFDIPLSEGEFLFNPGHSKELYAHGLVDDENVYQLSESQAKTLTAKVNLGAITESPAFAKDTTGNSQSLVKMIGQELTQTSFENDEANLLRVETRLREDPTFTPEARQRGEAYAGRLRAQLETRKALAERQASSADKLFGALTGRGIEIDKMDGYETASKSVNRILKRD